MIVTIDAVCLRVLNNTTPQVLTRKRDNKDEPAYGKYALIGGWVWEQPRDNNNVYDYNIEQALHRILEQKLGAKTRYIEQIPSVGSMDRDSRDWSLTVIHYCLLDDESNTSIESKEGFKWVNIEDVLDGSIPLPFDHQYIVAKAWFSFLSKSTHTSVGLFALPETFSVDDAVKTFNAMGICLTKQTLSKRFKDEGILQETGRKIIGHAGPPRSEFSLANSDIANFSRLLVLDDKYHALEVISNKEKEMRSKWTDC